LIDYIIKILPILFIVSIPSLVVYGSFSLAFLGYPLRPYWKKLVLFSILLSVYVDLAIFVLPLPYHFLNYNLAFFLFFFLIFRSMTWRQKLTTSALTLVVNIIIELISGFIWSFFVTRNEILGSPILLLLFVWPFLIIVGLVAYGLVRKNIRPGAKIIDYIVKHRKKNISYLLFFLFFQFLSLVLLIGFTWDTKKISTSLSVHIVLFISTLLTLIIIYMALKVISQTKDEAVRMTQQIYIEDINRMFTTIRGQRHDFLNHVQVILSFVKRGKIKELEKYTEELIGEITHINDIITIGHPALAALIQAKTLTAMENKIRFDYHFSHMDSLSLGVKSIDVVKIFGNLIDNAYDEVLLLPVDHRWVEVNGWADDGDLYLTVRNPGKPISEDDKQLLFFPGYTTKNSESHSGIGLSIVKERVEHYKGQIDVESTAANGTVFTIKIPLTNKLGYTS
jgi:signal transduction histidine kinase